MGVINLVFPHPLLTISKRGKCVCVPAKQHPREDQIAILSLPSHLVIYKLGEVLDTLPMTLNVLPETILFNAAHA